MTMMPQMVIFLIMVFLAAPVWAETPCQTATMDITETATITAMPNQATLSFTVESNSLKAQTAVNANAEQTQRLLLALKKAGESSDQLSTSGYRLSPVYEKSYGNNPKGYRAQNTITLKTKALNRLGRYIDEAVGHGANRVAGLTFSSDRENELQREAAEQALRLAVKTADSLAKTSGQSVKQILKITYRADGPIAVYSGVARMESARTPIEAGPLNVNATVQAVFEMNPIP